jgi:stage II sporulation protein D
LRSAVVRNRRGNRWSARSRTALASAAVIAIAACVSLVSPRGAGNVPAVRGTYKSGAIQLVRIALATAAGEGKVAATGAWLIAEGDGAARCSANACNPVESPTLGKDNGVAQEWRVMAEGGRIRFGRTGSTEQAHTGPVFAHPVGDSFLVWNGKRYRGDIVFSATDSGLLVVNRVPMDSYLRGVVPLEIGTRTSAEMAAVEAQAVAARTYAYKHLTDKRDFDMYATVQDQVYGGVDAEQPLSDGAITATQDVVVLYNGQPITTPYHSTCGGSTAGVSEVWYDQPDEPYLKPVNDRIPGTSNYYCDPSPKFSWTQSFDGPALRAVMEKYLATYTNAPKTNLGRITDIREQGKTASGRVAALTVQTESGSYTLRGNDIRFVLRDPKGTILNSTYFTFITSTNGGEISDLTLNGHGYGHGIGMCQWGAIGRARAGQDYRTILETYYPGTTIGRIAG